MATSFLLDTLHALLRLVLLVDLLIVHHSIRKLFASGPQAQSVPGSAIHSSVGKSTGGGGLSTVLLSVASVSSRSLDVSKRPPMLQRFLDEHPRANAFPLSRDLIPAPGQNGLEEVGIWANP